MRDRATKVLQQSGAQIQKFAASASQQLDRVSQAAGRLGKRVTLLGGVFAGLSVRTFATFERTFLTIQGVLRQTAGELEPLRTQILELGASTEFTARQVAAAAETFARAGLSQEEILQALPTAINSATAANIELTQSAEIITSTIKGQNRSFADAAQVMDQFTEASFGANVRIEALGENFPTIAANASQLGFRFEEVVAVLSLLIDRGVDAGEAVTSLNNILIRIGGNRAAQKQLRDLGIELTDSNGELLSLTDQIQVFEERAAAAGSNLEAFSEVAGIFGVRGRTFNTLVNIGSDRVAEFTERISKANGVVDEFSDLARSGLKGGLDQLTSAFEGLQNAFVEALLPQITAFIEKATQTLQILAKLNPTVLATVGAVTAFVGIGGILVGIVGSLTAALLANLPVIAAVTAAVVGLATATELVAQGLKALGVIDETPFDKLANTVRTVREAFRDAEAAAMGFKETVELRINDQPISQVAETAQELEQRFIEADGILSALEDGSRLSLLRQALRETDAATGGAIVQFLAAETAVEDLNKRMQETLDTAGRLPEIRNGLVLGPIAGPIEIPTELLPPGIANTRGVVEQVAEQVENEFQKFLDSSGFSLEVVDEGIRELLSALEEGVFGPDAERLTGQQAKAIREILARELDLEEILGVDPVVGELEDLRRRIELLQRAGVLDEQGLEQARMTMQQIVLEQEGVRLGLSDTEAQILRLETALQTGFLRGVELSGEAIDAVKRRVEELKAAIPPNPEDFWGGFLDGARQAAGAMDTLRATGQRLGNELSAALSSNLGNFFFSLGENINNADLAWREFAASVIRDLGRIAAQQAALGIVGAAFGGGIGGASLFGDGGIAKGGFTPIRAFADGGVVTRPTIGLVGERGDDEAVVPLKGGAIPVVGNTGGAGSVTLNINAIDARGVKEMLISERRTILGLIQEATRTDSEIRRDITAATRGR